MRRLRQVAHPVRTRLSMACRSFRDEIRKWDDFCALGGSKLDATVIPEMNVGEIVEMG